MTSGGCPQVDEYHAPLVGIAAPLSLPVDRTEYLACFLGSGASPSCSEPAAELEPQWMLFGLHENARVGIYVL
jgi:hypothetical protein